MKKFTGILIVLLIVLVIGSALIIWSTNTVIVNHDSGSNCYTVQVPQGQQEWIYIDPSAFGTLTVHYYKYSTVSCYEDN